MSPLLGVFRTLRDAWSNTKDALQASVLDTFGHRDSEDDTESDAPPAEVGTPCSGKRSGRAVPSPQARGREWDMPFPLCSEYEDG